MDVYLRHIKIFFRYNMKSRRNRRGGEKKCKLPNSLPNPNDPSPEGWIFKKCKDGLVEYTPEGQPQSAWSWPWSKSGATGQVNPGVKSIIPDSMKSFMPASMTGQVPAVQSSMPSAMPSAMPAAMPSAMQSYMPSAMQSMPTEQFNTGMNQEFVDEASGGKRSRKSRSRKSRRRKSRR